MFLGDWLGRRAWLTPDKVALVDTANGSQTVTYRQWNQAAHRSADLLRSLGVGKGDRVAILAHNCVEYLDVWFACGKLVRSCRRSTGDSRRVSSENSSATRSRRCWFTGRSSFRRSAFCTRRGGFVGRVCARDHRAGVCRRSLL